VANLVKPYCQVPVTSGFLALEQGAFHGAEFLILDFFLMTIENSFSEKLE
jgi:hypothetical protein